MQNAPQVLECIKPEIQEFCMKTRSRPNPEDTNIIIDLFTVVGLVNWPMNSSEAGVDLVLIPTSLLLLCRSSCSYAGFLVSKETVVLRRWERSKQKFGFTKRVDKG